MKLTHTYSKSCVARMAQDCKFKFLDYFSQENFYFLMTLTAELMIVNFLITLANDFGVTV